MIMDDVLVSLADGVAVLTVDRPGVRNAISPATYAHRAITIG